jgi:hypothetical protein
MEFCVRIVLTSGGIAWQITDPSDTQVEGSGEVVEDAPYRATNCFEATPGTWRLRVTLTDASGQYEVAWRELDADLDAENYLLGLDED